VTRTASGDWNGHLLAAAAGLSWEFRFGRFSLRPAAGVDYYSLSEEGYAETGGGDAFNLIVDERDSDELAGTATLAAGLNFGRREEGSSWLRAELEGGRYSPARSAPPPRASPAAIRSPWLPTSAATAGSGACA
jgi:Autotransporter beta-domain